LDGTLLAPHDKTVAPTSMNSAVIAIVRHSRES
jgi:hypothetical protein